jgi:tripartite-type tricarboxylate transporter receptor subunit TctC
MDISGATNDTFGRALAARLVQVSNSSAVVVNRQGANGNLGSAWVARSAPKDGSVYLVTVNSTQTINPYLYSHPGFDPVKDFEPVSGIAVVPHVLLTRPDIPVNSLADVLTLARQQPNKFNYGSSGNGTFSHLLMEMMKNSQKVQMTHIPYKGIAAALTDLIGNNVQYVISTLPAAMPFIKSGLVKPIAVTSMVRSSVLPEVPVANDTVPGMVGELLVTMYAPKGTPPEVIQQMHQAVVKIQSMPDMAVFFSAQGAAPLMAGPEELRAMTADELRKWEPVVKASGMKVD